MKANKKVLQHFVDHDRAQIWKIAAEKNAYPSVWGMVVWIAKYSNLPPETKLARIIMVMDEFEEARRSMYGVL